VGHSPRAITPRYANCGKTRQHAADDIVSSATERRATELHTVDGEVLHLNGERVHSTQ